MRIRRIKKRGRPEYIKTGGLTISVVPEVDVLECNLGAAEGFVLRRLRPSSLFVIDDLGVRRIGFRDGDALLLTVMLLAFVVGPLQAWIITRRFRRNA